MNTLKDRLQLEFLEGIAPAAWWEQANCAGLRTDVFFEREYEAEALAICKNCVVWQVCLRTNLEAEEGIFGGTTAEERSSYRQAIAIRGGPDPSGNESDDQG